MTLCTDGTTVHQFYFAGQTTDRDDAFWYTVSLSLCAKCGQAQRVLLHRTRRRYTPSRDARRLTRHDH